MTRRAPLLNLLMLMAASALSSAASSPAAAAALPSSGPDSSRPGERRSGSSSGASQDSLLEDGTENRTAAVTIDINGGFESGFTGWQVQGSIADVAVVPSTPPPLCFQPDMPSEGSQMACLSTENFFGGNANGDVRSDLTSDGITFPFRPVKLTLSFTVDFQTEEAIPSIAFNDAFQARLVTNAGTFVILQIDTFGRTTLGSGLRVEGFTGFSDSPPGCLLDQGRRTGKLTVTWSKNLDPIVRRAIGAGPVYVEFSVADQGGPDRTSIACVDDVQLKVSRAK